MNVTLAWLICAGEIIRAAAYGLAAAGICRLFRRPMAGSLGGSRWLFVALLAMLAGLQFVMLAATGAGCLAVSAFGYLAAAVFLLAAALLLGPFLDSVDRRLSRRTAGKLHARLRQARAQAAQSRSWLELAEELAHTGHWAMSVPDCRLFWSEEIYRIHGLARAGGPPELRAALHAFHPEDRGRIEADIRRAIAGKSGFEFEARLIRPDGQMRIVISRGVARLNAQGEVTRLFGVFMDVTEQKQTEAQLREINHATDSLNQTLRQLALLDALTGLPNRRHFDAAAEMEFKRAIRLGSPLGVIMVDLDNFKGYNDLYGHPAGDACLYAVAQALAGVPRRPGDFAARYGGEEFVILLPNTDAAGMESIARAMLLAAAELALPHGANSHGRVTVSCGAALFDPKRDPHLRLVLMQRADRALYAAKRNGRNCVVRDICGAADDEMTALPNALAG
jgi:diguanylate cyclase (GGDEF)-like protein/PAS domain S-box-containing protein